MDDGCDHHLGDDEPAHSVGVGIPAAARHDRACVATASCELA